MYYREGGGEMETVSLRLQEPLAARLTLLARKRKTSKSEIVREALEAYFVNGAGPERVTLKDLIEDLIIDDPHAPTDLSTNPKHMEDFGR
jgi:Ribbon-helix-helix protein, copG family